MLSLGSLLPARKIAVSLVVTLVAGLMFGVPSSADAAAPSGTSEKSVPVWPARGGAAQAAAKRDPGVTKVDRVSLPRAASVEVPTSGSLVAVGDLPVSVAVAIGEGDDFVSGARLGAPSDPGRVRVAVADGKVAVAAGVRGVVLSVSSVDGDAASDRVKVAVDYGRFSQLYGANFGERLGMVALPACVVTTPERLECQIQTPLGSVNKRGQVSAEVVLAESTVIGITSLPSSDAGTFTETSLSPAYSWSAGGQGGSFSWTYPLKVPGSLGGPAPDLSIAYNSGSVDAQTLAQNGQTSWIGEGWDLQAGGFIERSYRSCSQDGGTTGDLCWFSSYNATLMLGGRSYKLIRDSATGVWKTDDDNGLRVEQLFDVSLGNGDNDGEYWRVTGLDGTQYFFGKHKRYVADTVVTNSVQTVPVFGNQAGEPCHGTTWCQQGYRWNLDYVVDARSNSMTYFYTELTGNYGRSNNTAVSPYDISSTLDRIDYGTRAGSEAAAAAPMQVVFVKTDRCVGSCVWPSDFLDTPGDLYCTSATSCPNVKSPAFWARHKLSNVYTQVRKSDGSGYRKVNQWDLGQLYPSTGSYIDPPAGDDTSPNLWLQTIAHTGYAENGTTTLAEPAITFGGTQMFNRVDWGDDIGVAPYVHYRVTSIDNGIGGQTLITYSGQECPYRSLKPAPGFNPFRCFPQWHKPQQANPGYGWFHKYVVTSVTEKDLTAAGSPDELWSYAYGTQSSTDASLWGHDFNESVQLDYRSWPVWRGYTDVTTTHGPVGGIQTVSKDLFHRGMDGDSVATTDNAAMVWEGRRASLSTPVGTPEVTAPIAGVGGRCLDAAGTASGSAVRLWDCTGAANQVWQYNLDDLSSHQFSFKNPNSGRCLHLNGGGTGNGTALVLADCNGTAGQKWRYAPDGNLKNPNSGRCLAVAGSGTANGNPIILWDCGNIPDQKWQTRADGSLRNPQSARCIDVNGGGTADGTKIQSLVCNGSAAQQWAYSPIGSSLKNPNSGKCLDVASSGTANGTLIWLWECNNGVAQMWVPQSDGTLRNPNSGKCVDALNPPAPGVQLVIWDCNAGITQQWANLIVDSVALQGKPREQFTIDGTTVLASSIHSYTVTETGLRLKPVTGGQDLKSFMARETNTKTRTWIQASNSWRWTNAQAIYDSYGLITAVKDYGDTAISGDFKCTRIEYNRNTSLHLMNVVKQAVTTAIDGAFGIPCVQSPQFNSFYWSGTRYFYDGAASLDTAPTQGLVTKVEALASANYSPQGGNVLTWKQHERATYDINGRVTASFDALDRQTTTVYTPGSGAPITSIAVTGPMGAGWTKTTTVEPGHGTPKTVTDINGKVMTGQYDPLGRLVKVWLDNRSTGSTPNTQYTYTLASPSWVQTQSLSPNGNQISSYKIFDGRLRLRQTQAITETGKRTVTDVRYDGRGMTAKASTFYNAASAPTSTLVTFNDVDVASQARYVYDGLARKTKDQLFKNDVLQFESTTAYEGDRVGVIPPTGGTVTQELYDASGRAIEKRQYQSTSGFTGPYDATTYVYDRLGQLTTMTDPASNQWTYHYDMRGRKWKTVDPDAGTSTLTFDDGGQVTSSTDARGQALFYEYDLLGRRTKQRDGSAAGPVLAEWIYDTYAKGLLATSIRHVGADQYKNRITSFDDGYRPLHMEVEIPNSTVNGALAGTYSYDFTHMPNGAPETVDLPGVGGLPTETLTNTYDSNGFAQTLTGSWTGDGQTYVADMEYLFDGSVSTQLLGEPGKQVKQINTFDPATRRLTSHAVDIETATPGTFTNKYLTEYGYDQAGNVLSVAGKTDGTADQEECFNYDYLRRLTKAWTQVSGACTTPQRTGADPYWREWTFDSIGNRLSQVDKNSVAGDTNWTYQVGAAGGVKPHQVKKVDATGPLAGTATRTFGYDNAGNATTATTVTGTAQALTWTPDGRLNTVTGGTSYVYAANGDRLIARTSTKTVLYLPDGTELDLLSSGGPVRGTRYYGGIAVRDTDGLKWTTTNHQGTSIAQIDAATLTPTRRRMLPYGEDRGTQPTGWLGTKGYVGGTQDNTGLTHLRAREYDPTLGRFVSADPLIDLADPQQWNPYSYANNNPVTFSDPSGLAYTCSETGATCHTGYASSVVQSISTKYCQTHRCGPPPDTAANRLGSAGVAIACAPVCGPLGSIEDYHNIKDSCGRGRSDACDEAVGWALVGVITFGLGRILKAARTNRVDDVLTGARRSTHGGDVTAAEIDLMRARPPKANPAPPPPSPSPRPSKCHSFSPDTHVLMADGSTKPIAEIEIGDKVIATDPETGETIEREVIQTFINEDRDLTTVMVTDESGNTDTVETTWHHPFWDATAGRWVDASDLVVGHELLAYTEDLRIEAGNIGAGLGGGGPAKRLTVTKVDNFIGLKSMYDLTINITHTYYVLAGDQPVLVHNCGGLDWSRAKVNEGGVNAVETHLQRFTDGGPLGSAEQGMLDRLRAISTGGLKATPHDLRFYTHELRESVLYRKAGYPTGQPEIDSYELWDQLHTQALKDYGLTRAGAPYDLYHPSVR